MKLLKASLALVEAEAIVDQLKEQGIAAFISSEKSKGLGGIFTGSGEVSVWVVLDQQFDDAEALLKNPNHAVSQPLTATEMTRLTKQSNKYLSKLTNKFIIFAFLLILIVCLIIYGVYNYF